MKSKDYLMPLIVVGILAAILGAVASNFIPAPAEKYRDNLQHIEEIPAKFIDDIDFYKTYIEDHSQDYTIPVITGYGN